MSRVKLCHVTKIGVTGGENSSKQCENWSAHFSIKWASKSMIKFQFRAIGQKWNSVVHFRSVGLKGVQIDRNIAKFGVHNFISNGHANLWSNFNSENLVKSETPSFDFAKVWLKGGENGFEKLETNATCLRFTMFS